MPGIDIFTFLGRWWFTVIGLSIIVGMAVVVTIGIMLDIRDWKQRRK